MRLLRLSSRVHLALLYLVVVGVWGTTWLVFVLFPAVAQIVAVLGGERAMYGASLGLLALILTASLIALTGRSNTTGPPRSALRRLRLAHQEH